MSSKETIELKEVPLVESYPLEDNLPEDAIKQWIQYDLKPHTNLARSWKYLVIGLRITP